MTRSDIEHLAEVTHSLRSIIDTEDFDRLLDRLLWAIHASSDNPPFDDARFRASAHTDGVTVFDQP